MPQRVSGSARRLRDGGSNSSVKLNAQVGRWPGEGGEMATAGSASGPEPTLRSSRQGNVLPTRQEVSIKSAICALAGASLFAIQATARADEVCGDSATAVPTSLQEGFLNPPKSARPRLWWHWMNGNVTTDGIAKDLAWMQRIGIGGVHTFEINLMNPKVVDEAFVYMLPHWKEAFRWSAALADKAGLEFGIAGSPGWSESGGPWVPAADGMKKLVWSETVARGGRLFDGRLSPLPDATGPYQNLRRSAGMGQMSGKTPAYSGEAAVLAFRVPSASAVPAARLSAQD